MKTKFRISIPILALASLAAAAQNTTVVVPAPAPAQNSAAPGAPSAAIAAPLLPYTTCDFPDALRVVELNPLPPGVTGRPVETARGIEHVDFLSGVRVMFAYPLTDFFANVRVELLPHGSYAAEKKILLANMAYIESQPHGPMRAEALPVGLHGFDVHGNDRYKLQGSVLGMYLLIDDAAHIVATVDFLNQQSWQRKFQTMDQYGRLRDNFLRNYTGCIRQNQAIEK